jgi:mycofactocin precursor
MPDPEVIDPPATDEAPPEPDNLVEDELLVEDISIDGMCGVY